MCHQKKINPRKEAASNSAVFEILKISGKDLTDVFRWLHNEILTSEKFVERFQSFCYSKCISISAISFGYKREIICYKIG